MPRDECAPTTASGSNGNDRVTTFTTPLGWITAVGKFDDADVLRALCLAWQIRQKLRVATSVAKDIVTLHAILGSRASDPIATFPQQNNSMNQRIRALIHRHSELVSEAEQLSGEFANGGYDNLHFDGRLGRHLLPFEGVGLATASFIVATVARDLLPADDIELREGDASDASTLEHFKTAIGLRRTAVG